MDVIVKDGGPGTSALSTGLLGATGRTIEEAKRNRLLEIERRILAIEARLNELAPPPAAEGGRRR